MWAKAERREEAVKEEGFPCAWVRKMGTPSGSGTAPLLLHSSAGLGSGWTAGMAALQLSAQELPNPHLPWEKGSQSREGLWSVGARGSVRLWGDSSHE